MNLKNVAVDVVSRSMHWHALSLSCIDCGEKNASFQSHALDCAPSQSRFVYVYRACDAKHNALNLYINLCETNKQTKRENKYWKIKSSYTPDLPTDSRNRIERMQPFENISNVFAVYHTTMSINFIAN